MKISQPILQTLNFDWVKFQVAPSIWWASKNQHIWVIFTFMSKYFADISCDFTTLCSTSRGESRIRNKMGISTSAQSVCWKKWKNLEKKHYFNLKCHVNWEYQIPLWNYHVTLKHSTVWPILAHKVCLSRQKWHPFHYKIHISKKKRQIFTSNINSI